MQGDTSTTMLQPLAELGAICRRYDVLFYTDATASLGGNALETDAWGWTPSRPDAEVPRRPVGHLADHPERAHGGGDPPSQMR